MKNPSKIQTPAGTEAKDEKEMVFALVSYIGILCLIPLFLKRKNKFVWFHARQGFLLFICEAVIALAGMIPVIGWFIIWPIGFFLCFLLSIIGIVNALAGRYAPLPLIGTYAVRKI